MTPKISDITPLKPLNSAIEYALLKEVKQFAKKRAFSGDNPEFNPLIVLIFPLLSLSVNRAPLNLHEKIY